MLWFAVGTILFFALVFLRLLSVAARWGREWKELQDYGVEATGTVLRKISFHRKGGGHNRLIRYEYTDQFGARHSRKTMVTGDAWETHQEGGPIAIVYSQRTPRVSAPKYLLDTLKSAHPPV